MIIILIVFCLAVFFIFTQSKLFENVQLDFKILTNEIVYIGEYACDSCFNISKECSICKSELCDYVCKKIIRKKEIISFYNKTGNYCVCSYFS
jgi:hypothetical protein